MSPQGGRADRRRFSSLPMPAAEQGLWLSTQPARELLFVHFPALFLISFQQDELHLRMVDGEAPVAALEPGPTPLATFCQQTVSRLWLKHQAKKKQLLHGCLDFTFSSFLLQFLILI